MGAEFATRGFRSLGVARKRGEGAWEILGIMPCSDPPRHDTYKTISEAKKLGLSIKMLTGDAVGIARETSRQLGLGTNVYNAERLGLGGGGDVPGSEVYDFVEAADGFAEVFPQHKYSVVEILQQRGYLVAMTGDGVNDAPSLKKADTGIAVEGSSASGLLSSTARPTWNSSSSSPFLPILLPLLSLTTTLPARRPPSSGTCPSSGVCLFCSAASWPLVPGSV